MVEDDPIRARPAVGLALAELPRAMAELAGLVAVAPFLSLAPRGDGHPVLVLPGFGAGDDSTLVLRRYLTDLSYDVQPWGLGRNLGPGTVGAGGTLLAEAFDALHGRTGQRISLVGWSLGGILARELSRARAAAVRQVITLGSPFAGDPRATHAYPLFQRVTGQTLDPARIGARVEQRRVPPPVPSTAIYSRSDGVVPWQSCVERQAPQTDNIEVRGSHAGLGVNPAVLYAVAERLALPDGAWRPFGREGWRTVVYPSSGHPLG